MNQKQQTRRAIKSGLASEYIGCSRRTLHDLTKQGRIPCHKISARLMTYSIKDLDRFLDDCTVGGEA